MNNLDEGIANKESSLKRMKTVALSVLGFAVLCFFVANHYKIGWLVVLPIGLLLWRCLGIQWEFLFRILR